MQQTELQIKFSFDLHRQHNHYTADPQQLVRQTVTIEELPAFGKYFADDSETGTDALRAEKYPAQGNADKCETDSEQFVQGAPNSDFRQIFAVQRVSGN